MPLNALNLMYCKFHIAQIIIIEDIDNIIKGALEVFLSVFHMLIGLGEDINCIDFGFTRSKDKVRRITFVK